MIEQVSEGIESISRAYLLKNDSIITVGAILLFMLFTFVLYRSRMILLYKFSTFFSSRQIYASNEIITSNQELVDIILLIFIGCLSASTIFYSNLISAAQSCPQYSLLLESLLYISLLIFIKWILYSFINWTFFNSDKGRSWMSAVFFSIAIVSIIAFPLSLIQIYYNSSIINPAFCLSVVIILQKILLLCKLYVNFRPKIHGGVLFFLYFCSVEIMPTLIVWHILKDITL